MIVANPQNGLLQWSDGSVERLTSPGRAQKPRDYDWVPFLNRLRDWRSHPEQTVVEDEPPVSEMLIETALDAASTMFESGELAPTTVVPTGDGGISFERHESGVGPAGDQRRVTSLVFHEDGQVEFLKVESQPVMAEPR
jgi:hypothetical protein